MFTFFGKRYNETQWLYWSSDIQFERYIHQLKIKINICSKNSSDFGIHVRGLLLWVYFLSSESKNKITYWKMRADDISTPIRSYWRWYLIKIYLKIFIYFIFIDLKVTNEITIEVKFEYFTVLDVCGHLYTILNLFRRKINI